MTRSLLLSTLLLSCVALPAQADRFSPGGPRRNVGSQARVSSPRATAEYRLRLVNLAHRQRLQSLVMHQLLSRVVDEPVLSGETQDARSCSQLKNAVEQLKNHVTDRHELERTRARECGGLEPDVDASTQAKPSPSSLSEMADGQPTIGCDDESWFEHFDNTLKLQEQLARMRVELALRACP